MNNPLETSDPVEHKQLLSTCLPSEVEHGMHMKMVHDALSHPVKRAHFLGLFVVQGPTEPRHIRYGMEIASPELNVQFRCTQRYSNFYLLRKRLLVMLKQCRTRSCTDLKVIKVNCFHCIACRRVRKALKGLTFPSRRLFTTAEVVDQRTPFLEAFLDTTVKLLGSWNGCERGKRSYCVILGRFLGVDLVHRVCPPRAMAMTEIMDDQESFEEEIE